VLEFGGNWEDLLPLMDLLIIIAIKLLLVWLHMKHCMGGNVVPNLLGGSRKKKRKKKEKALGT
jgi:hypothetical protein